MFMKSKFQFWTFQILMIVLIIFICTKMSFLFTPIVVFISTIFLPIIVAGFLYFLFSPVVGFLQKIKIPKVLAILLLYIVFIGIITLIVNLVGPLLVSQITELINSIPKNIDKIQSYMNHLSHTKWFKWTINQDYVPLDKAKDWAMNASPGSSNTVTNSLQNIFGMVTNVALTIVTVPFILFYMLKDGNRLPKATMRFFPASYREEGLTIMEEMNKTLAVYIQGQMLVALFVAVVTSIGYFIIGLKYALLLGVLVGITNIIPYLGPFIGVTPAVIIGLLDSPFKAVLVIVVVVIVQQLDGHLISPLVIGKRLDTHPLTIIVLLLVAGKLAGPIGMILAIPTYAVAKTVILHLARLIKLQRRYKKLNHEPIE